ncbi:hypothetical protein [uncultured Nonlabens sp.]|uniref:hypothetical protein n=1 Tax=uncultured Nonlabens sp. TaxID=859306 RepID=UPI0030DA45FC|tara:strand:- start:7663 stop:8376 length:714 start_codon:yes stop_codon:yes gene_type:complete
MQYSLLTPPKYNDKLKLRQTHFEFDDASILSKLDFLLEDICSLYNISTEPLNKKNKILQEKIRETPYPSDVSNDEEFRALRINQSIDQQTNKVNSTNNFLNQVTAVYVWALVEQTENKLIALIEEKINCNEHNGFTDWKSRKKYFKELNINIDMFKNYFGVVELQKLNNKVKHLGKVDDELSQIKTFKGKLNYPLELVTIPVVDYLNNSYLYLIDLLCEIENKVFENPLREEIRINN